VSFLPIQGNALMRARSDSMPKTALLVKLHIKDSELKFLERAVDSNYAWTIFLFGHEKWCDDVELLKPFIVYTDNMTLCCRAHGCWTIAQRNSSC